MPGSPVGTMGQFSVIGSGALAGKLLAAPGGPDDLSLSVAGRNRCGAWAGVEATGVLESFSGPVSPGAAVAVCHSRDWYMFVPRQLSKPFAQHLEILR